MTHCDLRPIKIKLASYLKQKKIQLNKKCENIFSHSRLAVDFFLLDISSYKQVQTKNEFSHNVHSDKSFYTFFFSPTDSQIMLAN